MGLPPRRLRKHQIAAVARIGVRIRTRHVEHAGTTERGKSVGGSSCGGELSPGGGSTEVISDSRTDADRKMLIKRVGKHLLPAAQAGRLWRPGPPVAAPCARSCHPYLFATSFQVRPCSRSSAI